MASTLRHSYTIATLVWRYIAYDGAGDSAYDRDGGIPNSTLLDSVRFDSIGLDSPLFPYLASVVQFNEGGNDSSQITINGGKATNTDGETHTVTPANTAHLIKLHPSPNSNFYRPRQSNVSILGLSVNIDYILRGIQKRKDGVSRPPSRSLFPFSLPDLFFLCRSLACLAWPLFL